MVIIVDDDSHLREALYELLMSLGFNCATFGSAAEYTAFAKPALPACLVLDVELPDINGLDLQQHDPRRRTCHGARPPFARL